VDFGGGLERMAAASEDLSDIFKIDVLKNIIQKTEELSGKPYGDAQYVKSFRIIADHIRAASFMIADGIKPSNTDRGYFTRRLLRRAIRHADILGIPEEKMSMLVAGVAASYKTAYPELEQKEGAIAQEIRDEEAKFRRTLKQGLKEFQKIRDSVISGKAAFNLFSTYGFPIDMTIDLAKERGLSVDTKGFEEEFKNHQELSRKGAEKKFKGGLADTGEMSVKYHTATHLLQAALRMVLGNHISQAGSNITAERLRFDFPHTGKMTPDELKKVEELVNEKIRENLPISCEEMSVEEAKKLGALGVFDERYGDRVKVYTIGDEQSGIFSREICGGPHVKATGELGTFKIAKEEAVAAGVRRIKAVLE
jgi:alanyl-tRNA synthetase